MTPLHCGCGKDNDPWRRFCGSCGAALGIGCATCGFVNRTVERFCGGCGGVCHRHGGPHPRPAGPARPSAPAQRTMPIDVSELLVDKPNR